MTANEREQQNRHEGGVLARLKLPTLSRRSIWAVRILLILIVTLPAIGNARGYLEMFCIPGNIEPFDDATTYLAAGERLNAGHELYALAPGDRPVLIDTQFFTSPLVSPPLIGVIWRPLAAIPFGWQLWIAGCWMALLGTLAYLVIRAPIPTVIASIPLTESIANQLALANVTAFFPALLVFAWVQRRTVWAGISVALMASIKLSPATMFGWRAVHRQRRVLIAAIATGIALLVVDAIGAGPHTLIDYLGVATSTKPSPFSLSGSTGIPYASFVALAAGTLLAAVVPWEALSFQIAVATFVLGNPAFYTSGYVPLLALVAPFIGVRFDAIASVRRVLERRRAPVPSTSESAADDLRDSASP
jgi:hypothetical protein